MTLIDQHAPVLTWTEPEGIACRGTLVVLPGRGERPAHFRPSRSARGSIAPRTWIRRPP